MKKQILLLFAVIGLVVSACNNAPQDTPNPTPTPTTGGEAAPTPAPKPQDNIDWVIVPGKKVGGITRATTADDLKKLYGEENVKTNTYFNELAGGDVYDGEVFDFEKEADKHLSLAWEDAAMTKVVGVNIMGTNSSKWHLESGAKIGMSIKEIEQLNGGPFELYDFYGAEGSGVVSNWKGGKLNDDYYSLSFSLGDENPPEDIALGEAIMSDHPSLGKVNATVSAIYVSFAE